jgi:uncharacterized protein (TIGR00369 family)
MSERNQGGADDGRGAFSSAQAGAAAMTGLEIMRAGIGGARPGIGRSLNFWLVSADDGRVVFEGEPGAESLNPLGIIHGGWALTVIDSACGCATMTILEPGVGYTTLETKANMTRAIQSKSGVYRCEGKLLARGKQIVTAEASVTGPDGKLYAHGTSTLMILRPRDNSARAVP